MVHGADGPFYRGFVAHLNSGGSFGIKVEEDVRVGVNKTRHNKGKVPEVDIR